MEKKTGGPAFPIAYKHEQGDGSVHYQKWEGMTLRDYFAAKAMQEILSWESIGMAEMNEVARRAYEMADAMIAEREK